MDASNYSAGIAQISRKVWQSYSNLPYSDAAKPEYYKENIAIAAEYLKSNYHRFGSWKLALEAYNMGPTALTQVLQGQRNLAPITAQYVAGFSG